MLYFHREIKQQVCTIGVLLMPLRYRIQTVFLIGIYKLNGLMPSNMTTF